MATAKPKMTALEYMQQQNQGGGPIGATEPMSPGVSGTDKPTQGDSAINGFASVGGNGSAPHGQTTPAKKVTGHGGTKKELASNSKGKAGTSLKGSHKFPGGNHKDAISRRFSGAAGPPPTGKPGSRTGILANFEGFGTPQNSTPAPAKGA